MTVVKADKPIEVGQWHTVKLARHRKNGSLTVDQNPTVYGMSEGKFQGLDLLEPFYLGGLPSFYAVSTDVGHTRGFVGKNYKNSKDHHIKYILIRMHQPLGFGITRARHLHNS